MFDQLPDDIKGLIFSMNRRETSNEIKKNKINLYNVMCELEEISSLTLAEFHDDDEDEDGYTFASAMLECMRECEMESQMESRLDYYLEHGC